MLCMLHVPSSTGDTKYNVAFYHPMMNDINSHKRLAIGESRRYGYKEWTWVISSPDLWRRGMHFNGVGETEL
jgi:hypothetical protein